MIILYNISTNTKQCRSSVSNFSWFFSMFPDSRSLWSVFVGRYERVTLVCLLRIRRIVTTHVTTVGPFERTWNYSLKITSNQCILTSWVHWLESISRRLRRDIGRCPVPLCCNKFPWLCAFIPKWHLVWQSWLVDHTGFQSLCVYVRIVRPIRVPSLRWRIFGQTSVRK